MSSPSLPKPFQDLDSFVATWALATQAQRKNQRFSRPIEELRIFHDTLLGRMDEIIAYLNQFPLDELPEDAQRLFYLALSFMEVAPAVEIFGQPNVPEAFEAARLKIIEVEIRPKL